MPQHSIADAVSDAEKYESVKGRTDLARDTVRLGRRTSN
jgi:hypothetical protein